jgi:hypothetical protein
LSDVKAAREKNGIYIPNERFALEEAGKKGAVMICIILYTVLMGLQCSYHIDYLFQTNREKIEHLELSLQGQGKV